MRFTTAAFALAAFASLALAHVEMIDPPPFRSKANKFADQSTVDFDMNSPLDPTGINFPCKGYQKDFNTPAGDTNVDWPAGSPQTVTLLGSATHNGGSCQLSLSYDGGKTFRVIKSIEGNCAGGDNKFDFTVPADAKTGKAIFAWTWFNHTGNREMYMNCAAVNITGSGTSTLDDRPEIFTANIGGDCSVPEGTDVQFPNPGPDLQVLSKASLGPPVCKNSPSSPSSPSSPPPEKSSTEPDSADPTDSADPNDSADPTESCDHTETAKPTASTPVPSGTSQAPASTSTTPTSSTGPAYVVKTGDICTNIAAQQGVSLDTLFKLNPAINKDCTNLKPGQTLVLRRRSRIMRDLY